MAWYGMVWYGMPGMVWCMVWYVVDPVPRTKLLGSDEPTVFAYFSFSYFLH